MFVLSLNIISFLYKYGLSKASLLFKEAYDSVLIHASLSNSDFKACAKALH